ncbi:MAG: BF3164 family lipoprotein [Bacteroidota bacterium]
MLIILFVLILAGCEQESAHKISTDNQIISFSNFDQVDRITLQERGIEIIAYPAELVATKDYLALIDINAGSNPWVQVFDKKTLEPVGKIVPQGKGPGEALNPGRLLPIGSTNSFWVFDGLMQRFQQFDVEAALLAMQMGETYKPEYEFLLEGDLRGSIDPKIISDSLFVTTTYSHDDCRFFYFNSEAKILEKVGKLPPSLSSWPEQGSSAYFPIAAAYYRARIATHPTENWVAVGYSYTDEMEIYKDGQLVRRVLGPENIEIDQKITEETKGIYWVRNTDETVTTYVKLYGAQDFILAEYVGKDEDDVSGIHIFDWEGRPIKKIQFNPTIQVFCIEKKDDGAYQVYVIDIEESKLRRVELNIP